MDEKIIAIRAIMNIEQRAMRRNPPRNIKADAPNLRRQAKIILGYWIIKEEVEYLLGN